MSMPVPQRGAYAIPASAVRRQRVRWLQPGRVPLQTVTCLAGVAGLGKSLWSILLAAENPGRTLLATSEDAPGTTIQPRLEAAGADLEHVSFLKIQADDGLEDGLRIPDDVDALDELVEEMGVNLVVVDPLVAHIPFDVDSHKDASVRHALAPLYRLAVARDCAVLAVMHLNKQQGLSPLARLSGSGAFGNLARSVLLLDRDPDDPDGEKGRRRVLAHVKCNVAPLAPSLLYEIDPILLPAEEDTPEVETSRLRLVGESPHNAHRLLAAPSEEDRSAIDEAKDFLLEELSDDERRPASQLFKAARAVGISDRTLRRARQALGVEIAKAGFNRGWEWWLPKGPSETGKPAFLHEDPTVTEKTPSLSGSDLASLETALSDEEISELGTMSIGDLEARYSR